MKRLSERQINTCETSRTWRCKCRCKGALHGVRTPVVFDGQQTWVQLLLVPVPPEQQHRPTEEVVNG